MSNNANAPKKRRIPKGLFKQSLHFAWQALTHNIGLKLLSLVMAILLWNYVITSNTSITRTRKVNNLTGYITGQSTLSDNGLALLEDPQTLLSGITVVVDAPQAYYSRISSDNVQVTLDLSRVRTAGTQEVTLRANTSYGRVTSIEPESLTLTFEAQDSRSIPVNAVLTGDMKNNYWYSITRINPTWITVSGASSVVRSISSAVVSVDVTGRDAPYVQSYPYALVDQSGELIEAEMLTRSTSSASVSVDVYPTKELPVSNDPANVVTGQPAEGYVVQSVTMQPETVTVAADRELLDGLTELVIKPVGIDGMSQSFTTRSAISQLSGLKNLSTEQVYVNIVIAEASITGWIEDVEAQYIGKNENLRVSCEPMRVHVTGPGSDIEALQSEGLFATLDLTGLEAGVHSVVPVFDVERYPNVTFRPETDTITVTLTDIGEGE